MDLVITILGWIALGVISAYLLAIVGKIIFDAATADYKLYKHVRLCRKRLLRQRYEDYAWLLFQLEKDTEVFNLTHNTRDWTFEDWREFYLKKAKELSMRGILLCTKITMRKEEVILIGIVKLLLSVLGKISYSTTLLKIWLLLVINTISRNSV